MASSSSSMVINGTGVCTTPGPALVAKFNVSDDMRTTERLMVTTTVLMTLLGTSLFFVGVLGRFSGRHRGHSTATRIFFRASFALFLPFMSYMFSQAKSEHNQPRAQLILLWMLLVGLLRKKVYAMVVSAGDAFSRGVARYSFFDAIEEAASMVWIGYLVYSYVHDTCVKSFFIILWVFSVAKLCKRALCIHLAKGSFDLAKNAVLVSGYMTQLVEARRQLAIKKDDDHDHYQDALGPNIMRTCNYLVMGESRLERKVTPRGFEISDQQVKNILLDGAGHPTPNTAEKSDKSTKLVRLCNIWHLVESDTIFRYDERRRRKVEDICLALALFKLLRRRIERLHMAEARTAQARSIVLHGLLALDGGLDEAADADRAFQVVELELRFLDEYYQAIIPLALPKPSLFIANFAFSIVFILVYCATVLLVTGNGDIFSVLGSLFQGLIGLSIDMVVQYRCFVHQVNFLVGMVCSSSDLIVTFLLTLTLFTIETYEFVQYLLSDWFVASVLCNYALKQRRIRQVIKGTLLVKHRSPSVIKVHQITVLKLHQLHPRRVWMLVSRLLKRRLVGLPDAVVTTDTKVAIVRVLKNVLASDHFSFSDGKTALRRHGFPGPESEWACCDDGGAATVIMVWHLATSLFETKDRQKQPLPPDGQAAVTLSRYCAYLVAYEPGLLPDDEAWTEEVYKGIKDELNSFFQSCCTDVHRRKRLMTFYPVGKEETSTMAKGVKLGKQLEEMAAGGNGMHEEEMAAGGNGSWRRWQEEEKVWRMLLEFWAELLVLVARRPSAGPEAHALALANGGEFITHIWAMLTHAGVRVPSKHQPPMAKAAV